MATTNGSHGNTISQRFEGDASTLKLASLRSEVYHGRGGLTAQVVEGVEEIVGTGFLFHS
jgi:hypothetical protein